MAGQHTLGPWTIGVVEEDDASWFEVRGPSDDNGWATVVAGEVDNHANARLIAAAPDLLAALEALAEVLPGSWDCDEVDGGPKAWNAARAAISKARGQV